VDYIPTWLVSGEYKSKWAIIPIFVKYLQPRMVDGDDWQRLCRSRWFRDENLPVTPRAVTFIGRLLGCGDCIARRFLNLLVLLQQDTRRPVDQGPSESSRYWRTRAYLESVSMQTEACRPKSLRFTRQVQWCTEASVVIMDITVTDTMDFMKVANRIVVGLSRTKDGIILILQ
jgi:hypothetical protein